MTFPAQHRTKKHSTNPIERLNSEIKRRTGVIGIISQWGIDPAPRRCDPHGADRGTDGPARQVDDAGNVFARLRSPQCQRCLQRRADDTLARLEARGPRCATRHLETSSSQVAGDRDGACRASPWSFGTRAYLWRDAIEQALRNVIWAPKGRSAEQRDKRVDQTGSPEWMALRRRKRSS